MFALTTGASCGGGPESAMLVNNGINSSISSAGIGSGPDSGGGELPDGGGALDGGGEIIDPFELEEWEIVEFTDPRDSSVYDIIDGRVIIAFKDPPDIPLMDPNYFDVERDPETDPYYQAISYHYDVTQTLTGLTQVYDPEIAAFLAAESLTVYSDWAIIAGMAVVLPEGQTVADAVANWPGEYPDLIQSVDPDRLSYADAWPDTDPNDSLFPSQWNLDEDELYDIEVQEAWREEEFGHPYIVVAVLDTGVQYDEYNLEDLIWRSTPYGCNTGDKLSSTEFKFRVLGGGEPWEWLLNRSVWNAMALGHGTCVASTISALIDNDFHPNPDYDDDGVSLAGICHENRYFPVAIKANADENRLHYSDSAHLNAYIAIGCVKRVYDPAIYPPGTYVEYCNIEVVNCSYSSLDHGSDDENRYLDLLTHYMLFVGSAGNGGLANASGYPGNHPLAISVASYDKEGSRCDFSNYFADEVDIAAQGTAIPVLDMYGRNIYDQQLGFTGFCFWTDSEGTSVSTPQVAAGAALVQWKWQLDTPAQIRHRLLSAAQPLPDPDFIDIGRLSVYKALGY